jgi:ketosteroid isomerase-like protein
LIYYNGLSPRNSILKYEAIVRSNIRQLTDVEWLEAGRAKDLDRWMSFYTDETGFFPPDGPLVKGKEAMRKLVSNVLANPGYESSWETTMVEVSSSGDMAYSFGPQQTTHTTNREVPATRFRGNFPRNYFRKEP